MARLFVAVPLPASVIERIDALPRPDEPGVRWTRPNQWHVTLRFLGDADVDAVSEALKAVELPPATATLGPQVSRLGRTVVCIPVAGVDALAAVVIEATAALGEPPEPRPFRGHVTLGRLKHRGACGLAGERFEATFPCERIELVDSALGAGGPRYETRLVLPVPPTSS